MKYMGDSEWWNNRFKTRELKVMRHEKILEDDISCFPKRGKILDIACGDGRNAIYLSRLGYEVIAIDFCEEALNRLNYFIKNEGINIDTQMVDLSKDDIFNDLGSFDVVIINHYRLKPQLYSNIMNHIKKDGVLWVNGFREVPNNNPNITEYDILKESDFLSLDRYILENRKSYEIDQRKFIRYLWKK